MGMQPPFPETVRIPLADRACRHPRNVSTPVGTRYRFDRFHPNGQDPFFASSHPTGAGETRDSHAAVPHRLNLRLPTGHLPHGQFPRPVAPNLSHAGGKPAN